MVKSRKNRDDKTYVAKVGNNNIATKSGTKTCEEHNAFLESHGAVKKGLESDLRHRFTMIIKFQNIGLSCV